MENMHFTKDWMILVEDLVFLHKNIRVLFMRIGILYSIYWFRGRFCVHIRK